MKLIFMMLRLVFGFISLYIVHFVLYIQDLRFNILTVQELDKAFLTLKLSSLEYSLTFSKEKI